MAIIQRLGFSSTASGKVVLDTSSWARDEERGRVVGSRLNSLEKGIRGLLVDASAVLEEIGGSVEVVVVNDRRSRSVEWRRRSGRRHEHENRC